MGIDCFLEYDGKIDVVDVDGASQYANIIDSSGVNGDAGYLVERYFRSNIYATKILFEEAWIIENHNECRADSKTLKSRIPDTIRAIAKRELDIVNNAEERNIIFESDYILYDAIQIKVNEYLKFINKFEKLEKSR